MSSCSDDRREPKEGQDDAGSSAAIQLGFSVLMVDANDEVVGHRSPRWTDWDGGQIGGRPSWLQPRDIPKQPLTCLNCGAQLDFLCQLYAPAPDHLSSRAFHRSLYVFGCSACKTETEGSVRVLRGQLPKENPFYPAHCDNDGIQDWNHHTSEAWNVSLCRVCGQRGKGMCPVQKFSFCGRQHQKEHKQRVFDKQSQDKRQEEPVFLPSVYAESELVVEEEPPEEYDEEDLYQKQQKAMFSNVDEHDLDQHLEQEDLNEMTGSSANSTKDPVTLDFYARLKRPNNAQEQVLRYCQWPDQQEESDGAPLWIHSDFVPESIPSCPYCGEPRRFEFQLMPQMLHYLLEQHRKHATSDNKSVSKISDATKQAVMAASAIVERNPETVPEDFQKTHQNAVSAIQQELLNSNNDEMDWGVIAVYTCTASCGGHEDLDDELGAYREEYAWRQPPLH